ncbi:TrlF family AAA-like ATPase [Pseudomonas sp. MAC6]|uniref:TrlF family AAA-like ATPase n=1 Tax=Pseudomonas sp. MAC6 TaxID=3401633 RepID=UPI003BF4AC78
MSEYQGMRWFKADFQVQTPEDSKNWDDFELRLGNPRRPKINGQLSEESIQEKARIFLRRCHELELQIIGITDHNFSEQYDPNDWFLTHLLRQNKAVAKELQREPIYFFPGFEVDIGYHVLCLFETTASPNDLMQVNRVLTKLGLPENERFDSGEPKRLRQRNATVSLAELIDIVQKEYGGLVIPAHADQNDGLFAEPGNRSDYQHPDLLAVEITQYPLGEKIKGILTGRNPDWARPGQQPAFVRSSDAKSLKKEESGKPKANSLGYRYTWLKCSKPSIAALKQAFRDQSSRICLDNDRPSDCERHPRIRSISLANTRYLEDQKVVFSQNLNTLIGARGTGKSTILELLRIMFAREQSDALSEKALSKANRAKDTLLGNAQILVEWEGIPGQVDTLQFSPDSGLSLAVGDAFDLATYLRHLPVQFYSQQQLSDLTAPSGQLQLLEMLDEACADDLAQLDGEERALVAEIKRLFAGQDQLAAIDQQIVGLNQELVELERQWQARKDVQGEAAAYQRAQRAKRYLQGLHDQIEKDVESVKTAATALSSNVADSVVVAETWPHTEWISEHTAATTALHERFKGKLADLLKEMTAEAEATFAQNAQRDEVFRTLDAAQTAFVQACEAKGIQPQDVSRLQELDRSKQAKQLALDEKKRERLALEGTTEALGESLSRLFAVWAAQTALRMAVAEDITQKTGNSIRVSIKPMAYQEHFEKLWMTIEPDRRTRIGREWQILGENLFMSFSEADDHPPSPWEHIHSLLSDPAKEPEILWQFKGEVREFVESQEDAWRTFRVTRIPDVVDIELYRPDRSLVGSLEGGQLSEGQRNTAILHMLLVKGDGPIIIDQPEDEVDASFIYKDLVPLLRQAKSTRQLILATHNANLPVNADAEFVFALESVNGRGGILAQGGLDRKETALAVLDIMEGSEEAFRRRFEKYHF